MPTLILNSIDRTNGSPTNFKIAVGQAFKDVSSVSLVAATMPQVAYNINSTNNSFTFKVDASALINPQSTIDIPITITEGAYNAYALAEWLQTKFRTWLPTMTVSYSETTMKFRFYCNGAQYTIKDLGNLKDELGFVSDRYDSVFGQIIPENCVSLSSPSIIYVSIPQFPSQLYRLGKSVGEATFYIVSDVSNGSVKVIDSRYRCQTLSFNPPLTIGGLLEVKLLDENFQPILNMNDYTLIFDVK